MRKYIYKLFINVIHLFFLIELLSVIFLKEYMKSELWKILINYSFWYSFGLLSGFYITLFILKNSKGKT